MKLYVQEVRDHQNNTDVIYLACSKRNREQQFLQPLLEACKRAEGYNCGSHMNPGDNNNAEVYTSQDAREEMGYTPTTTPLRVAPTSTAPIATQLTTTTFATPLTPTTRSTTPTLWIDCSPADSISFICKQTGASTETAEAMQQQCFEDGVCMEAFDCNGLFILAHLPLKKSEMAALNLNGFACKFEILVIPYGNDSAPQALHYNTLLSYYKLDDKAAIVMYLNQIVAMNDQSSSAERPKLLQQQQQQSSSLWIPEDDEQEPWKNENNKRARCEDVESDCSDTELRKLFKDSSELAMEDVAAVLSTGFISAELPLGSFCAENLTKDEQEQLQSFNSPRKRSFANNDLAGLGSFYITTRSGCY